MTTTDLPMSAAEKAFEELDLQARLDNPDEGTEPDDQEDPPDPDGDGDPEAEEDDQADTDDPEQGDGDGEDDLDEDGDDEGDDSDDDEPSGEPIELSEKDVIRLPDGTEVPVEKAALFQSDYTKKTQAVAQEREQLDTERKQLEQDKAEVEGLFEKMSSWYDERSQDPGGWVVEIASQSSDPTRTVAKALKSLAESGQLDPKFVETFGLESGPVAEEAQSAEAEDRLARLEQELEQQKTSEQEQARVRQAAAEYQRQWNSIKQAHGVEYSTPDEERAAKAEVLQFAREREITSLEDAYDLLAARKARQQPEPAPQKRTQPDPETTQRKRQSRAVTPRSTAGGGGAQRPQRKGSTTREAALIALEQFASDA